MTRMVRLNGFVTAVTVDGQRSWLRERDVV
jgi:hypothetical protein